MTETDSWFDSVIGLPPLEIFELNQSFLKDTEPTRVNLSIGAYRTEEGKPWVLPGELTFAWFN